MHHKATGKQRREPHIPRALNSGQIIHVKTALFPYMFTYTNTKQLRISSICRLIGCLSPLKQTQLEIFSSKKHAQAFTHISGEKRIRESICLQGSGGHFCFGRKRAERATAHFCRPLSLSSTSWQSSPGCVCFLTPTLQLLRGSVVVSLQPFHRFISIKIICLQCICHADPF